MSSPPNPTSTILGPNWDPANYGFSVSVNRLNSNQLNISYDVDSKWIDVAWSRTKVFFLTLFKGRDYVSKEWDPTKTTKHFVIDVNGAVKNSTRAVVEEAAHKGSKTALALLNKIDKKPDADLELIRLGITSETFLREACSGPNPSNEILMTLADTIKIKNPREATELYARTIEGPPISPTNLIKMGLKFFKQGEFCEAYAFLNKINLSDVAYPEILGQVQFALGEMLEKGQVVEKDGIRAAMLYAEAEKNGDSRSAKAFERVSSYQFITSQLPLYSEREMECKVDVLDTLDQMAKLGVALETANLQKRAFQVFSEAATSTDARFQISYVAVARLYPMLVEGRGCERNLVEACKYLIHWSEGEGVFQGVPEGGKAEYARIIDTGSPEEKLALAQALFEMGNHPNGMKYQVEASMNLFKALEDDNVEGAKAMRKQLMQNARWQVPADFFQD